MSKETENFLNAEQSAQKLIQALEDLKNEAISYKTSAHELDAAKGKLLDLVDSFLPIVQGAGEVVSVLKSTHPEVLDKLGALSSQVSEQSKTIRSELEQKVKSLSEQLNRLRLLTIIGLSIAGLSVIGIVVLLLR